MLALGLLLSLCGCGRSAPDTLAYEIQRSVCLAIADVNFHQDPCIKLDQIAMIEPALRSGDIILRRRYGNLSNAFIPGFWTHAAIYLGTGDELARLGLNRRGEIAEPLRRYCEPPASGRPLRVIHAPADGVVFTTLEDLLQADAILVLRPVLDEPQRAAAIATAIVHLGRPYDFDFDLESGDRVTCTELLWRAYGDVLDIQPVTVLGRRTVTADQIAASFAAARSAAKPAKLDFVLLLMGDAPGKTAQLNPVEKLPR